MKNQAKKIFATLLSWLICIPTMVAIELAIYFLIYPSFIQGRISITSFPFIKIVLNMWHLFLLLFVAPKVTNKIDALIERKMGIEKKETEQVSDQNDEIN